MLKQKCNFLALAVFMMAGLVLSGNAQADPVCETLEECVDLRAYLEYELLVEQSQTVRVFLRSQLRIVNARIEELSDYGPGEPEERETNTGAVFTRDRSHAELGEAWRDPDGLIWGDVVTDTDGSSQRMNHYDATDYCASIGTRLPSRVEFIRLREYMGAQPGTYDGYSAQVLPNLSDRWFWSSSVNPSVAVFAYGFSGGDGNIDNFTRNSYGAVRCVVDR